MIRDRLVVGLRDAKFSERLQLDADLTLETALTKARQSEAVHQQQAFLRGKEDEVPVVTVNRCKRKTGGKTRLQEKAAQDVVRHCHTHANSVQSEMSNVTAVGK